MSPCQNCTLKEILLKADRQTSNRGNYSAYSQFKREIELLDLSPQEYQVAIIKLAKILRV